MFCFAEEFTKITLVRMRQSSRRYSYTCMSKTRGFENIISGHSFNCVISAIYDRNSSSTYIITVVFDKVIWPLNRHLQYILMTNLLNYPNRYKNLVFLRTNRQITSSKKWISSYHVSLTDWFLQKLTSYTV